LNKYYCCLFFAGAVAELELIELLRKLPENFYIINDVKLSLRKGMKFDGEWLQSAQIDHLVISPAGIFVIEAKNWSKEFIKSGDYFNPYQQVSALLIYVTSYWKISYKTQKSEVLLHTKEMFLLNPMTVL
jgi:Nuclease-related domain